MKLLLPALMFAFGFCKGLMAAEATKPNVILILADDIALGDLASINGVLSRTPNLDQLRKTGVGFRQAYSASPVCGLAHAASLTGRYPHRTGIVKLNTALASRKRHLLPRH